MNESGLRDLMLSDDGLLADRHDLIKEHVMATIHNGELGPHPRVAPRRFLRRLVPVMASLLVLVVAGTAAALGLLPWQAQDILGEIGCRDGSSIDRLVAIQKAPDGRIFEFWTTSTGADGPVNGHIIVERNPDGSFSGMGAGCAEPGYEAEPDAIWVSYQADQSASTSLLTITGHVPPRATMVEIVLSNGTSARIAVQTDGYFLGLVFGPGVDMPEVGVPATPELVHLTAVDADGRVIVKQDLP